MSSADENGYIYAVTVQVTFWPAYSAHFSLIILDSIKPQLNPDKTYSKPKGFFRFTNFWYRHQSFYFDIHNIDNKFCIHRQGVAESDRDLKSC